MGGRRLFLVLCAVALAALSGLLAFHHVRPSPWAVISIGFLLLAWAARREREDRRQASTLRLKGARFRALVKHASDMILVVEPGGTIRVATGATLSVLGVDGAAFDGRPLADLVHPDDVAELTPLLAAALDSVPGTTVASSLRMRHRDGRWVSVELVAANLVDEAHINGLVLTCRDVTARELLEAQLLHRAYHDPLTQLPNRALLLDRLELALGRPGRLVGLLFVDIDDFKVVNDTLGHAAGDGVLTAVASRLRGCLRSVDTAARLGGDEFAVLVEDVAGVQEVQVLGERILDTLRRPFVIHGEPVHAGVSVGMVVEAAGAVRVEECLRRADFAMYAAKRNGKGRAELFDPVIEAELVEQFQPTAPFDEEAERATWLARAEKQRAEIEEILAAPEERLRQVVQPIVDLRTGHVIAYEALARFEGSRRPPNAWFAQAHHCGLGIELELCAARAQLAAAGRPKGTRIALNLSPSVLLSVAGQEVLAGDLSHLIVEVTEDELVAEGTALEERLSDLRSRGARLAVDDVGAGYAGLKQVVRLRPDLLKVDRALVDGVAGDPAKAAMIDALVRYARRIGSQVCAEGIESLEDLRMLADLDVTFGQGYALARPAEGWASVSAVAAEVCASSHLAVIRHDGGTRGATTSAELRLERVCFQISSVTSHDDLRALLEPIRELLGVDEVVISLIDATGRSLRAVMTHGGKTDDSPFALADYPATAGVIASGEAIQVLASDPAADAAERAVLTELGQGSLLMVPLLAGPRGIGVLELYTRADSPWSRAQVHGARILSYQLARVLVALVEQRGRPRQAA